MLQPNDELRRAAILIDSLDSQAADSLLDQMEPSQADRVRRALLSLGDVSETERESVIGQFLGRGQASSGTPESRASVTDDSGIEVEESLAARFATSDQEPDDAPPPPPSKAVPFQFLSEAEGAAIVPFLRDENPQAIAVVLAHLPPERAADVLSRLSPGQQAEVVRRIVHLDEMAPEVLRDVEQELGGRLFEQLQKARRRTAGVSAMCQILNAADVSVRNNLLASLSASDTAVVQQLSTPNTRKDPVPPPQFRVNRPDAEPAPTKIPANSLPTNPDNPSGKPKPDRQLPPQRPMATQPTSRPNERVAATNRPSRAPMLEFGDLAEFNDAALSAVFEPIAVDVIELALTGAEEPLVRRIIRRLPATRARRLTARLKRPGPMRLSDVERAQQEIVRLAERLACDGKIKPARKRQRLAMTA